MSSNATENKLGVHVKTIFFLNFLSSTGEEVFYGHQQSQRGKKKAREEETGLLYWRLSPLMEPTASRAVDLALLAILPVLGGDVKQGTAPPGEGERKIQKDIEKYESRLPQEERERSTKGGGRGK